MKCNKMTARASAKGAVVIPVEIRKRHHIKPGTRVHFLDFGNGVIHVIPLPEDPIKALRGS